MNLAEIREKVEAIGDRVDNHAVWVLKSEVLAILGEEKFKRKHEHGWVDAPNERKGQQRVLHRRGYDDRVPAVSIRYDRRLGVERRTNG